MRNKSLGYSILLVVVSSMLVVNPAWAQKGEGDGAGAEKARKEKAATLYGEGKKQTARGDELASKGKSDEANAAYGAAVSKFLEAYKNVANPLLLYVLAQVYQTRGELSWAKRCYQKYLDEDRAGAKVADAEKKVAELLAKEKAGGLVATTEAPWLDPVDVCYSSEPKAPEPEPTELDPTALDASGRHHIDRPGKPGAGYRIGFWTAAGVTAGSAAVALVTLLQIDGAVSDKEEAIAAYEMLDINAPLNAVDACSDAENRQGGAGSDPQLQAVVDACSKGKTLALVSNAMQGVAIVGLLASGFLFYRGFLANGSRRSGERTTLITPTIARDRVGAQLQIRF